MKTFSELWNKYSATDIMFTKEEIDKDVSEWNRFSGHFNNPSPLKGSPQGRLAGYCCSNLTLFSKDLEYIKFMLLDIAEKLHFTICFSPVFSENDSRFYFSNQDNKVFFESFRSVDIEDQNGIALGWNGVLNNLTFDIYDVLIEMNLRKEKQRSFPLVICITPSIYPFRFEFYYRSSIFASSVFLKYTLYCFYGEVYD